MDFLTGMVGVVTRIMYFYLEPISKGAFVKFFAVRLNPDTRETKPYSAYPSLAEYKGIHKNSPMNGFHECVNFLPENGVVKGYLPPKHLTELRESDPFILITTTAATAKDGNKIIGVQVGCKYTEEIKRVGSSKNESQLNLVYHYTCPETLSLLFDHPLEEARKLVVDPLRPWIRGPVYKINSKSSVKKILEKAIKNGAVKKSNQNLKKILEYIDSDKTKLIASSLEEVRTQFDIEVDALESEELSTVKGVAKPAQKEVSTYVYERSPKVAAYALQRAKGICEGCKQPAPFLKKSNNLPYLETHHILSLSMGGSDTIDNVIALCPNCHRNKHFGQ